MNGIEQVIMRTAWWDRQPRAMGKLLVIGRLFRIFQILKKDGDSIVYFKLAYGPRLPPNMLMVSGNDIRKAARDLGALPSGRE